MIADYGTMSSNALIKHTYLNFPLCYSQHYSQRGVAGKLYERIEKATPKAEEITLFTIGYEGISQKSTCKNSLSIT